MPRPTKCNFSIDPPQVEPAIATSTIAPQISQLCQSASRPNCVRRPVKAPGPRPKCYANSHDQRRARRGVDHPAQDVGDALRDAAWVFGVVLEMIEPDLQVGEHGAALESG